MPLVGEGHTSGNKVSVYEAAEILGVTVDAIRKRISRDSIPHERDEDGRVWVLLDATSNVHDTDQEPYRTVSAVEFIEEMRGRIDDLREQLAAERRANEENRRIIAALTQRIPEIEPARDERESPETATESTVEPTPSEPSEGPQRGTQRHPWFWWWAAWVLLLVLLAPAMWWVVVNLF